MKLPEISVVFKIIIWHFVQKQNDRIWWIWNKKPWCQTKPTKIPLSFDYMLKELKNDRTLYPFWMFIGKQNIYLPLYIYINEKEKIALHYVSLRTRNRKKINYFKKKCETNLFFFFLHIETSNRWFSDDYFTCNRIFNYLNFIFLNFNEFNP